MKHLLLKDKIIDIPNFPKQGVTFKDITPLLQNKEYFAETIKQMVEKVKDLPIDVIAGIESRGFIFAPILAHQLNLGFVPIRKLDKLLPGETVEETYKLEYGNSGIKIQKNAIMKGQNVLIIDDLIATGGSASAAVRLIEQLEGNVVGLLFLSELTFLNPRKKLKNYNIMSIIKY